MRCSLQADRFRSGGLQRGRRPPLLLDLDDPGRVLGALADPLLVPNAAERDGLLSALT